MRTFRCIYVNCFNKLRFLQKIVKNTLFGQFTDHNSGRKHRNQTNDPIFFVYFFHSSCFKHSFLYLKIVKIHFDVVPTLVHSGLYNTSILGKSYRFGQPIILFQNADTLRLLKIHIMLCPPSRTRKKYQLMGQVACHRGWRTSMCTVSGVDGAFAWVACQCRCHTIIIIIIIIIIVIIEIKIYFQKWSCQPDKFQFYVLRKGISNSLDLQKVGNRFQKTAMRDEQKKMSSFGDIVMTMSISFALNFVFLVFVC